MPIQISQLSVRIRLNWWVCMRRTGWLRLEGSSGGHLTQSLLKQWNPEKCAHDHVQVVSEDLQEGDSIVSNLCQCSITCTVQKCCLLFRGNLLAFLWLKAEWHLCASEALTCLKCPRSGLTVWLHLMWDAESATCTSTSKCSSFRSDMSHVSCVATAPVRNTNWYK